MSTLEGFTILILSFGELGCPMKCIELSVLTLASSDLSITLDLCLSLSISFPLTRVEPAIPIFVGGEVLITWGLLVADCFDKMVLLLTGYDGGLNLPWFTLSWFTLSIFRCRSCYFTVSAINAALFAHKKFVLAFPLSFYT